MPKPTIVPCYKTPTGLVETLAQWKSESLKGVFASTEFTEASQGAAIRLCIQHADEVVEILSHREKGRPTGAKDRKPRTKKATEPSVVQAA